MLFEMGMSTLECIRRHAFRQKQVNKFDEGRSKNYNTIFDQEHSHQWIQREMHTSADSHELI